MKFFSFSLVIVAVAAAPSLVFAQGGFVPLIGIPGLSGGSYNVNTYINILYVLSISIAAFLAVLRLILAGLKYMLTDVVPQKESAKKDIQTALVGLLIVVGAVLILETINPQLTRLNALDLQQVNVQNFQYAESVPSIGENLNMEDNLDTLDNIRNRTSEEISAFRSTCEGAEPPGRFIIVGDEGRCLGNQSESSGDNVVNTPGVIAQYLADNNLSDAEALALQQQYNQFVAAQEPPNLTDAEIAAIRDSYGASDVVFVVSNTAVGVGTELVGYEAQQESLCERLTGSNNFVVANDYSACLVE